MKSKNKPLLFKTFFFLLVVICTSFDSNSQEIVITNPDGLNSLWNQVEDNGSVREGVHVNFIGNTQSECATLALKRFKRNINQLQTASAIKDVVNTGFKALGLVVPSGYAKYALLALKMTYKALSADSPEEFENEAVKETVKQIGGAGINIKSDKLLEKSLKEAFKKIVDALFKGEKKDIYNKPLTIEPCKNGSVVITLGQPEPGDTEMEFTLYFTMTEECNCNYPSQNVSGLPYKLNTYNIQGSMPVKIKEIEYEEASLKILGRKDKIKLTVEYGVPTMNVIADCDCRNISYTDGTGNCSYKSEFSGGYSYLSGQVGNDMVGFPLGGYLSFIYNINKHVGAGADVSYHRKKEEFQTLSRTFILARGQYSFGNIEDCDKDFFVEAHILFGLGMERIKFSSGSYSNTSKGSGFAFGGGAGAAYKISRQFGLKFQGDFIGIKFKNSDELNKNLRASLGLVYDRPFKDRQATKIKF